MRAHLGAVTALDVLLAVAFGLLAIAVVLASGWPHAVFAHLGPRGGWRLAYDTGLLGGLAVVGLVASVLLGATVLLRHHR